VRQPVAPERFHRKIRVADRLVGRAEASCDQCGILRGEVGLVGVADAVISREAGSGADQDAVGVGELVRAVSLRDQRQCSGESLRELVRFAGQLALLDAKLTKMMIGMTVAESAPFSRRQGAK